MDDGEQGDDFEEPDDYDVPTVRADDHYEAHRGEANHFELKTSSENDFRESKISEEKTNFPESSRHGKEQNEFSKSFIAEESPDKNRIKSLLKFLQEKNSAHLLSYHYSTTSSRKSESPDDKPVSTTTTRDGGHRGRGGQGAVER